MFNAALNTIGADAVWGSAKVGVNAHRQAIHQNFFAAVCRQFFGDAKTETRTALTGSFPACIVSAHIRGEEKYAVVKLFLLLGEDHEESEFFEREIQVYKILGQHKEIAGQIPHLYSHGVLAADSNDSLKGAGVPYVVLSVVPGVPAAVEWSSMNTTDKMQVAEETGRFLAKLHTVDLTDAAINALSPVNLLETLQRNADNLIYLSETQQENSLAERWKGLPVKCLKGCEKFIQENLHLLEPSSLTLIHGDAHRDHVFLERRSDSGTHLKSVIDFGDARYFDPAYEDTTVHLDLLGGDWSLFKSYRRAYLSEAGTPKDPMNDDESYLENLQKRKMIMYSLTHEVDDLFERIVSDQKIDLSKIDNFQSLAKLLWDFDY